MGEMQPKIALGPTMAPAGSFLDWPVVTDPNAWSADVAVIGLPHSEPYAKDPWPNDQASAPDVIRAMSSQFSDGPDHWDFDLDAPLGTVTPPRCIDCGDVPWTQGSYDDHAAHVTAVIGKLFGNGTQVFVLGGDHGVTIPVLDALAALKTPVHIVHFDAHLDWRPDIEGVQRGYSSPLYWASTRPWISGMTQIGLRGTGSARRSEVEAALAYGSCIVTAKVVHAEGLEPTLESVPAGAAVYVTIDADGLDPTEMPGVMGPVPGGLYFRQIAPFLRALGQKCRIVGGDIVEVAPSFDASNHISCITAGRLIINLLGAAWPG
ncbi:MAG: Agmatinase [Rhodospirillales bacterium]|nr:Agmatinase [Rhodospirillales bacterium]